jgi:hypothetical protein
MLIVKLLSLRKQRKSLDALNVTLKWIRNSTRIRSIPPGATGRNLMSSIKYCKKCATKADWVFDELLTREARCEICTSRAHCMVGDTTTLKSKPLPEATKEVIEITDEEDDELQFSFGTKDEPASPAVKKNSILELTADSVRSRIESIHEKSLIEILTMINEKPYRRSLSIPVKKEETELGTEELKTYLLNNLRDRGFTVEVNDETITVLW